MVVGVAIGLGPMVLWNRLAVLGPLSKKLATPVPRSSSTTGCCRNVGGGWLPCRRKGRPAGVGFAFSVVFSLAISISVSLAFLSVFRGKV